MKTLATLECRLDRVSEQAVSYRDKQGNIHYFDVALFGNTVPRAIVLDVSIEEK